MTTTYGCYDPDHGTFYTQDSGRFEAHLYTAHGVLVKVNIPNRNTQAIAATADIARDQEDA